MNRKRQFREVDRSQAAHFFSKAEEFVEAARADLEAGRFSAAGLAAIHAGISTVDAVTVSISGVVNVSPDHGAAVEVLRAGLGGALPAPVERQIIGLLKIKHEVEYTQTALSETKARVLVDQATRLVRWSAEVVARHG